MRESAIGRFGRGESRLRLFQGLASLNLRNLQKNGWTTLSAPGYQISSHLAKPSVSVWSLRGLLSTANLAERQARHGQPSIRSRR
jgi:hypothetical protein